MGDGHGAQLAGLFHELRRARQLGSDVHNAHQTVTALKELLEALKIRLLQVVGVLGAPLFVGEVGAFHLDAHEPGVARGGFRLQLLCGGEGFFQHVVGERHGGGGEGGHAAACVVGGHFFQALIIAVGEIRAGVAMAVDIHQTGYDGGALQINGIRRDILRQYRAEQPVLHFKPAGDETEIRGKNSRIFIKHRTSLLYISIAGIWYHEVGKKAIGFAGKVPMGKETVENGCYLRRRLI